MPEPHEPIHRGRPVKKQAATRLPPDTHQRRKAKGWSRRANTRAVPRTKAPRVTAFHNVMRPTHPRRGFSSCAVSPVYSYQWLRRLMEHTRVQFITNSALQRENDPRVPWARRASSYLQGDSAPAGYHVVELGYFSTYTT